MRLGAAATDTRAAESRHRILARAGITLLVLAAVAPVTGYVGQVAAPLVERCRELLAQCALVLRAAGAPLHWVPLALLGVGVAYALVDRVRLTARVSRVLAAHRTRRVRSAEPLGRLAREYGVEDRVRVLVGPAPNPAFTAGLLRPRVYVAEGLQRSLTAVELRAVFRHELSHLARRDPLYFAALRFATKALFWLPLIRVLADDLMEQAELAADDFASAPGSGSDPLDVASALIKIGRSHAAALAGTAAIGGFRFLDRRVRRLADEPVPVSAAVPRRAVLLSAVAVLALWLSATFVPGGARAGMTMQWGDPCPHAMAAMDRTCAECERHHGAMPGCPMEAARATEQGRIAG